jgi:hypothetical protein
MAQYKVMYTILNSKMFSIIEAESENDAKSKLFHEIIIREVRPYQQTKPNPKKAKIDFDFPDELKNVLGL